MEPEGSLICSQRPATDPYPEPDASSPQLSSLKAILILYFHLRLGLPSDRYFCRHVEICEATQRFRSRFIWNMSNRWPWCDCWCSCLVFGRSPLWFSAPAKVFRDFPQSI